MKVDMGHMRTKGAGGHSWLCTRPTGTVLNEGHVTKLNKSAMAVLA